MLGIATQAVSKLREVLNSREAHKRLQEEEELQERAEKHVPRVGVEFLDTPAYDVLARMRVIRQRGRVDGDLVEHAFAKGQWLHQRTQAVVKDEHITRKGKTVVDVMTDKHDVQPMSVIRVVGDIDFASFVTSAEHRRQLEKRRIFKELEKVEGVGNRLVNTFAETKPAQLQRNNTEYYAKVASGYEELLEGSDNDQDVTADELPPPASDAEAYKEWSAGLKKHQIARFIKQYLQRSIPRSACTMSAVVIVTSTVVTSPPDSVSVSDIALMLNKGMFSERCKTDVDKSVHADNDVFITDPMLVGVHVWESKADADGSESALLADHAITTMKDRLSQFDSHLFLTEETHDEDVALANRPRIIDKIGDIVRTLGNGNDRATCPDYPFRMKAMGTVYVLIGGKLKSAVLEIQQAVEAGRPVLVVEGSGGYADVLCGMIRRVEEVVVDPSIDDYRNCLGAISPRTSSIISSGCIRVVQKGTSSEVFAKTIQKALSYDEALHNAWQKYAQWDYNSQYCRGVYLNLQMLVLALGIMTITLSILQTSLQLQYPVETGVTGNGATNQGSNSLVGHIYTWTGLVVVILPVGLSLIEAIENKLNAGGRWVALRSAAESMLREIYMYRTEVRNYSPDAIRKGDASGKQPARGADRQAGEEKGGKAKGDKQGASGEAGAAEEEEEEGNRLEKKVTDHMATTDDIAYKSRQEKLSQWIEHLIGELKESECANNSLLEYEGPLPPPHVLGCGDEGWKDLTPDEYIAYRVGPLICRYERAAKYYENWLSILTLSNYVLGALGTLLAALSSVPPLDGYNLQSWVSLTTGFSNAVTRYMDYARMDFLQKKSNKVKMDLTGVQSWWDSRGNEAGSYQIRHELVTQVEALVTGEFIEWGGQMKKAMDKAKKEKAANNSDTDAVKRMREMESLEKVKQLKEMGLAGISADSLAAALEDPEGAEASKIKDSLSRLQTHIEKNTGIDSDELLESLRMQDQMKIAEALKSVSEQYLDDTGSLLNINLGGIVMSDFVPADVADKLKTPKVRRRMFRDCMKLNPAVISRSDCLGFFDTFGDNLKSMISELSQRQMLETVKSAIVGQLHEELIAGLKNFGICIYDLIPRDDMVEELLLELRDVGKVQWRDMETQSILQLIKSKEIRNAMSQLNEIALRGLLKRADKLFKSKTAHVFQSAVEKIAKLDVEELFDSPTLKAEMFDTLDDLSKQEKDIVFMPKSALLSHLPQSLRDLPHVKNKPQAQLVEYIHTVRNGFSISKKFSDCFTYPGKTGAGDASESIIKNVLRNKRLCDRFFFAVSGVTQSDINRFDKKSMMRQLAMSPAFSTEIVEELKYLSEPALKYLMSGMKSSVASTYQARVFDLLCDTVTTFDLRNLLPSAEDREKFVNQVREFKGVDLASASKEEMITTLAFKSLVVKFLKLSREQIAELVERSLILMGNAFHSGIFVCSVAEHHSPAETLLDELSKWDDETADKLCLSLMRHTSDLLGEFTPHVQPAARRLYSGQGSEQDEVDVAAEMLTMFPDQTLQALFTGWDIDVQLKTVCEMRDMLDERVLASIFEGAANDLPPDLASKFQGMFIRKTVRNYMLECLSGVVDHDFVYVTTMSPDELVSLLTDGDPTKKEFFRIMHKILAHGGSESAARREMRDIMVHILNEILLNVPYSVFLKLCLQNNFFDLRELLDEPQTRRVVAVVLLRAHQSDFFGLNNELRAGDILDGCDNLFEYETTVNDMRVLSEEQLLWLTREVISFFSTRDVGAFFAKYLETNQEHGQPHDRVDFPLLMEAVISVKSFLMLSPMQVRTDFRFFDSEQFFTLLTEDEKMRILQKYIADDSVVRRIASFNQVQFARLFAHMQAFPSSRAKEGQAVANRQSIDMRTFFECAFKDSTLSDLQSDLLKLLEESHLGEANMFATGQDGFGAFQTS